jgi:hypothetical protein
VASDIRATITEVERRLSRGGLSVVVVGETKAGKSTFLNAILGERVLGAAHREYTGAITYIRRTTSPNYRARFRGDRVYDFAQVVPDRSDAFARSIEEQRRALQEWGRRLKDLLRRLPDAQETASAARTQLEDAVQKLGNLIGTQPQLPWWAFWRRLAALLMRSVRARAARVARDRCLAAFGATQRTERQLRDEWAQVQMQMEQGRNNLNHLLATAAHFNERRRHRFLAEVRALSDMAGQGPDVIEVVLEYPGRYLPAGLTIIDTPGVNTDSEENRARAWAAIRDADGCILLSDLQQAVSQSTREFLRQVREFIPHVILILTKVDRVLANAEGGRDDPWKEVEEARRGAVKRFAREVGRDSGEVLTFTVAAECALAPESESSPFGARFKDDMVRLFGVLYQERATVLGARCAQAVRRCIDAIGEAQECAEATYRQRIADLQAQRIPDPADFSRLQMLRIEDLLTKQAADVIRSAKERLGQELDRLQSEWAGQIRSCESWQALKELVLGIEAQLPTQFQRVQEEVQREVLTKIHRTCKEVGGPVLQEFRRRYQITRSLATASVPLPANQEICPRLESLSVSPDLSQAVQPPDWWSWFVRLFQSLESLKQECVGKLNCCLDNTRQNAKQLLQARTDELTRLLRSSLKGSVEWEIARFGEWIQKVIQREGEIIGGQHIHLQDLIQLRTELQAHNARLKECMRSVASQSQAMCR